MERLVKGDVVVVPFPFSDLSSAKKRPALVLASRGDDTVLCQITSKQGILLSLSSGALPVRSYVKAYRLFSADKKIILRKAGRASEKTLQEIDDALRSLLLL